MSDNQSQKNIFYWPLLTMLIAVGSIVALAFWHSLRYGRRLFKQPRLSARLVDFGAVDHTTIETKAAHIASENLRGGIERRLLLNGEEKLVLCAGIRNFREPWARDFGFSSFGLIELDEFETTRECLEVFLIYQRPNGQFPVKVHGTSVLDRYIHSLFRREQPTHIPIKPKYITAHNTISLDGNSLLISALLNYAERTGDYEFAKTHWSGLKKATVWLNEHNFDNDGLLQQSAFADWADSIARTGRILYTNVVYWKALHDMAESAEKLGFAEDQRHFTAKANKVKAAINNHFWRADLGYYITSQYFDNLSSSGNLLAVAWGLTTPEQAHSILDKMNEFDMATPVPTQVVHRAYPNKFIAIENRLVGIGHYHTYAAWLWLGAWHVIALTRMERLVEAEELLYRLASVIVRDGAVHEVYDPNGKYLSTFWYTSEAPLTWSAGMVVHAYHVYQRWLRREQDESQEQEIED